MNKEDINKIEEYISSIEQLGADSRWSLDFENWGALEVKLKSIIYWCNKGINLIKEVKENER